MKNHNNLFFLCENCHHPNIISLLMEVGVLPKTKAIQCGYCDYKNTDLEGLKEYAKQSRTYSAY